jgi:hypothetical protein
MSERKTERPVTLKEVLSDNVKRQRRRSQHTASPQEAQRPARERVRDAEQKKRH